MLFKSIFEAVEDLYTVSRRLQQACSETVAEWDSGDSNGDTFGIGMAREALKKAQENPLLMGDPYKYQDMFITKEDKPPTLEEAQEIVGGLVELISLSDGRQLLVNEEGALDHMDLEFNPLASIVINQPVWGKVICLLGDAQWVE